jgi:hypothetical protein
LTNPNKPSVLTNNIYLKRYAPLEVAPTVAILDVESLLSQVCSKLMGAKDHMLVVLDIKKSIVNLYNINSHLLP